MSSSESESPSESGRSTAPTRKKKQAAVDSSDSSVDHDTADASSNEKHSDLDAPRHLPSTETTVLSHAERRRNKKKEKRRLLSASVESPRKKRKLEDGTPATTKAKGKAKATSAVDDPRRSKRQNSIWVGNLSFRTTQDALRTFFDGVGTITRIHMPMRRGGQVQGENMGFAYVDFGTPDAKVIAITLSEGQLDGRNLLIKDGDDFTGRPAKAKMEPLGEGSEGEGEKTAKATKTTEEKGLSKTAQKILRVQKQPPAPTLFLGNLGFETTEESIRELFEAHRRQGRKIKGKEVDIKAENEEREGDAVNSKDVWIRKIRMGTFEDSGNCKGFAFVDFTSVEHATEALVNPRNHRLNGRDLVVEYASPDAVRRGGSGPRHSKTDRDQRSRSGVRKVAPKGSAPAPYSKERRPGHAEQQGDVEVAKTLAEARGTRSRREHSGYSRSHTRRAKPGAALAHAQRQSAAIMPSQGQKIVF